MRKVYFATLPNGYFGSAVNSWNTLDIKLLSKLFVEKGYFVQYIFITDIRDIEFKKTDILIYTSSEREDIRAYLKDVLYFVKDICLLLPSYEILLAHENKGFQEIMRNHLNIENLNSQYLFDIDQVNGKYPFVYKNISGSGSNGVELVKNDKDLQSIKRKYFSSNFNRTLKNLVRASQLPKENYKLYNYYYKPFRRFVTQDFIKDLTCDYRVLVVGNRFYAMRRDVREGDFRASGSKKFHHHDVPFDVLNYSKIIFQKLNSPYISMDLAYDNKEVYLIEYQGTNFGSTVLRKSSGYYVCEGETWSFVEQASNHEETLAYGLINFVELKNE